MQTNLKLQVDSILAFVTVAEEGSFSAAARKLKKSQPSVSVTVQNLESDLGYNLFDRVKNKPVLTHKGKELFQASKSLIEQYQALITTADTLVRYDNKRLVIGIDPLVCCENCQSVLYSLSDRFSDLEIEVLQQPSSMLANSLDQGIINIAFGFLQPEFASKFDHIEVSQIKCAWAATPEYFAQSRQSHHTLILHNTLADLRPYSHSRYRVWKFDRFNSIIELCLQAKGLTYLPEHYLSHHFNSGRLVRISQNEPQSVKHLMTSIFWSHNIPLTKEAAWLLGEFRKMRNH